VDEPGQFPGARIVARQLGTDRYAVVNNETGGGIPSTDCCN
jgi:hypothetical protein